MINALNGTIIKNGWDRTIRTINGIGGTYSMSNHNSDSKYDEKFVDKLVQILNLHRTQIQTRSNKPTVIVWDLDSGEMRGTLDVTESIQTVSLTPDGSKALTCQELNDIVTLWNLKDLSKITDITPRQYSYSSAVFSPDGKKFAVGGPYLDKGILQIYDSEGKTLGDELMIENSIYGLCWFSDSIRLLTYSSRNLSVVNSTNGEVLPTKKLPDETYVYDACISPDDSKIVIASSDGVQVFVASDLSSERSLKFGSYASSVTFNNSGDMVLFSCEGYTEEFYCNGYPIVIWDYANNTIVDRQFGGHTDLVNSLTRCRANSALFFSGGRDMRVLLWDMETGYVVKRLKGCSSSVNCVDISADCRVGISGQQEPQYITEQMVRLALENDSRMITRRG